MARWEPYFAEGSRHREWGFCGFNRTRKWEGFRFRFWKITNIYLEKLYEFSHFLARLYEKMGVLITITTLVTISNLTFIFLQKIYIDVTRSIAYID